MMMKIFAALAVVAITTGASMLKFQDSAGTCTMEKVGGAIEVANCDLKFPAFSDGIAATTSAHATSIADLAAAVDILEDKFTYLNKACPAGLGGAIGVGVNTNYMKSDGTQYTFGENLDVGCSPGYVPNTVTLRCHFDGWYESDGVTKATSSSEPSCVVYKCPAESLTYGGTTITFPETVNRHLNTNYIQTLACPSTHHGSITRKCHYNMDTWSATEGNCEEKTCPAITYMGHSFVSKNQGESHLTQNCDAGYTGTINVNCGASCSANSAGECTFSTSNNCNKICSIPADTSTASFDCSGTQTQGNSCTQSCKSGFTGSATTRHCQTDGSWSGSNPSCTAVPSWTLDHSADHVWVRPCYGYTWGTRNGYYSSMAASDATCRAEAEAVGNKYYGTWYFNGAYGQPTNRGVYCWKAATKPSSVCTWSHGNYYGVKGWNWVKNSRRLSEVGDMAEMAEMSNGVSQIMDSADHEIRNGGMEEAIESAKYGM